MHEQFTTLSAGLRFNRGAFAGALLGVTFALAGCGENGLSLPFGARGDADQPVTATPATQLGSEAEAPQVFSLAAQGLWDGRPSLGGVWVAAPGVRDPERVVIRHAESGAEVIGALFRRERENPGPPIQVSSDAAAALGLLAGQPARLAVVALRPVDPPASTAAAATGTPAEATQETALAPAPAATGGAMLQVATLTSQIAADAVVARLRAEELTAEVRPRQSGERTFYRVLTGPAAGAEARTALQSRVAALGYADAFFLSN